MAVNGDNSFSNDSLTGGLLKPDDLSSRGRGNSKDVKFQKNWNSNKQKYCKNKNRRVQARQALLDNKLDNLSEIKSRTQDDLLKMEKYINLETKYYTLTNGNKKWEDIETALAGVNLALTSARCHISLAYKFDADTIAEMIMRFVKTGTFPHANKVQRSGIETVNIREIFDKEMTIRRLLIKIYVVRYSKFKTGKFLQKGLSSFILNSKQIKGQWEWPSSIRRLGAWLRGAGANTANAIGRACAHIKSAIDYVKNSLCEYFVGKGLECVAIVIVITVILGGCSLGMFHFFKSLIISVQKNEAPIINIPQSEEEKPTTTSRIQAQGGFDKGVEMISGIGESLSAILDSTAKFNPEAFINRFGKLSSSMNSIEVTLTKIWGYLKPMIEFIYMKITDKPLFDMTKVSILVGKSTKTIADQSERFNITKKFTIDDSVTMTDAVIEIRNLLAEKLHTVSPALASSCTSILLTHATQIQAAFDVRYAATAKVQPPWLHLVGESDVGKSTLTLKIVKWLRHITEQKSGEADDFFDRKVDNEYWEGYNGQFALFVDDWMQTDDVEQRRMSALEMIYMANTAPYHLHMAGMNDKVGKFFDSKFIFTTSNFKKDQVLPDNLGITDYNALYRRMTNKYKVERKKVEDNENDFVDCMQKFDFFPINNKGEISRVPLNVGQVMKRLINRRVLHTLDYQRLMKSGQKETLDVVEMLINNLPNDDIKDDFVAKPPNKKSAPPTKTWAVKGQCDYSSEDEEWFDCNSNSLDYDSSDLDTDNEEVEDLMEIEPKRYDFSQFEGMFSNIRNHVNGQMDGGYNTDDELPEEEYNNVFPQKTEYEKGNSSMRPESVILKEEVGTYTKIQNLVNYLADKPLSMQEKLMETGKFKANPAQYLKNLLTDEDLCQSTKEMILDEHLKVKEENDKIKSKWSFFTGVFKTMFSSAKAKSIHGILMCVDISDQDAYMNIINLDRWTVLLAEYLVSRLQGHYCKTAHEQTLNLLVAQCDFRIRCSERMRTLFYDVFSLDQPVDYHGLVYNWEDQAFNQWFAFSSKGIKWPNDRPMVHYRSSRYMYWAGGQTVRFPSTDFPKSMIEERQQKHFKDRSPVDPNLPVTNTALSILSILGLAVLVSVVVTVAVQIVVSYLFQDKAVLGQSYDKNTEKRALKSLRKKPTRWQKNRLASGQVELRTTVPSVLKGQSSIQNLGFRLAKSVEYVSIVTDKGTSMYCFALFVTGNEFATAGHGFKVGKVSKIIFHLSLEEGQSDVEIPITSMTLRPATDGRDLMFCKIKGSFLPLYKDLRPRLNKKETFSEIKTLDKPSRITFGQNGEIIVLQTRTAQPYMPRKTTLNFAGETFETCDLWICDNMENKNSECGLPYFTANEKFDKPIVGIHTAGMGSSSFFTPIYAEDFDSISLDAQTGVSLSGTYVNKKAIYPDPQQKDIKIVERNDVIYSGLKTIGEIHYKDKLFSNFMADKTALRPTICQESFVYRGEKVEPLYVVNKIPAKLKPFREGDIVINPLDNALSRLERRISPVPPDNINKDKNFRGIFHRKFDWNKIRKLSLHEAINGIKGSSFIGPIDLSTSSSIGHTEFGVESRTLFNQVKNGNDCVIEPSARFMEVFNYRLNKYYKNNVVPPFFCLGTLKDETKEKSKAAKPRIFANGSKVSLIEARIYFATIFEQVVNHTGEGDVYIGINPHSSQWSLLYKKLASKSITKIIADDIAAWDFNMRLWFIDAFMSNFRQHCTDEELLLGMELTLYSVLTPYIVIKGIIYRYIGMPSGSYITAMINSMYNSWKNRTLWDLEHPEKDFDDHIAQATFGDDLTQAVSDELDTELWNGQVLARLRKKWFGIDTTSIFKDQREVPKFLPLGSTEPCDGIAQFLKRQWIEKHGIIFPALSMDSIHSMTSWVRPTKERNLDLCTKENIETALKELAYHGEKVFNQYKEYYQKIFHHKQWGIINIYYEAEVARYLS